MKRYAVRYEIYVDIEDSETIEKAIDNSLNYFKDRDLVHDEEECVIAYMGSYEVKEYAEDYE